MLATTVLTAATAGASLAPRTGNVLVSTYTSGTRQKPSVVATGAARYLVVWEDRRPEVEGAHVRGRAFDGDGALLGTEFQVDTAGSHYAEAPSIVRSEDSVFAVVWRSDPRNGERPRLLAQRIDAEGAAIGTAFQLNTPRVLEDGEYYLGDPATAPASNGGFVVVWSSGTREDDGYYFGPRSDVHSRRFFADGEPIGLEHVVSEPTVVGSMYPESHVHPDVAALEQSGFTVVWAQGYYGLFGSFFRTTARALHPSGQPSGAAIVVGSEGVTGPHIVARGPAGFTVVWSTYGFVDYIPQQGGDVVARTFDAYGEPIDERFLVSAPVSGVDPRGDPLRPYAGINGIAVGAGADGEFVVAWAAGVDEHLSNYYGGSSDGDKSGIFARDFGLDDAPSGSERQVNFVGEHDQTHPDLAFGDADTLAIVWDADETGTFARDRIYARIFDLITPGCGDADEDGDGTAGDALFVLQSAIGARACPSCLCDVNASGAQTAADALMVLQESVGLEIELACPPCNTPGVAFSLQSDATCYGAHVGISAHALPDDIAEACAADPGLALLGCATSFGFDETGMRFDARGCFLKTGSDLFSCSISGSDAEAIALASSTACGCGCAETCPAAFSLCAHGEGEAVCAAPDGPATAVANPTTLRSVTATGATVTSTTTCGTCCDYYDEANIELESAEILTELVVRFSSGRDPGCFEDVSCSPAAEIGGPHYERFLEDGDTVEVCLADREGVGGPTSLAYCSVLTGFISRGPAEVMRALGRDLEPITPAPPVLIE